VTFRRVDLELGKDLGEAWSAAETAAKRSGAQLRGLVRREALLSPEPRWVAWSQRASGEPPVEGTGDTPTEALAALTKALSGQ
jgi:hypothetical protein